MHLRQRNMNSTPIPQLSTPRLLLRDLKLADGPEILVLRSDDRVNEFIDRPKAITLANAEAFIGRIQDGIRHHNWLYWAVSLKEAPGLIGTVCLWRFVPEKQLAEIGYELLPGFQGRGLMREAVAEVIRYGFSDLHLQVITALTHRENIRSSQLLKRLGFQSDTHGEYGEPEDPHEELYFLKNKI